MCPNKFQTFWGIFEVVFGSIFILNWPIQELPHGYPKQRGGGLGLFWTMSKRKFFLCLSLLTSYHQAMRRSSLEATHSNSKRRTLHAEVEVFLPTRPALNLYYTDTEVSQCSCSPDSQGHLKNLTKKTQLSGQPLRSVWGGSTKPLRIFHMTLNPN